MKKILMACAACAALMTPAPAQDLPTLSQFLSQCYRDSSACRMKLRDYITAANTQKNICLPENVSVKEAASETLRWLRSEETHPQSLNDGPFDDGLFAATQALYPCKEEPAPPPPPPPPAEEAAPPADQPAPDPAAPPAEPPQQ